MKLVDASKIEGCKCEKATTEEACTYYEDMCKNLGNYDTLSAPQIGVFKRFFVMKNNRKKPPWLVINPEVKVVSPKKKTFIEECQSYPGKSATVVRYNQVLASWINQEGKRIYTQLIGKEAQSFQRGLDYLNGVTITS